MWTAHRRCKHTDKCLMAITNLIPIPFLASTSLILSLTPLACYLWLRLFLLVQVDGTSCMQYVLKHSRGKNVPPVLFLHDC